MAVVVSGDERTDLEFAIDRLIAAAALEGWGMGFRHAGGDMPYKDQGIKERKKDLIDTIKDTILGGLPESG